MLVCRRWREIMISTPGIHFQLRIRESTHSGEVQKFIQDRKMLFTVAVDMSDEEDDDDDDDFVAENFHECFTAASQAASRWRSLILISPPPHGEYNDLQILQPLTHLETIKSGRSFDKFIEPLMTAISRNSPPNLTTMDLAGPVAVLFLVQPACLHVTHSLTTLKIHLAKKMDSPVDILPHLQRLKTFEASRLSLPIYPPDASLPLIHTLAFLDLKSVSVQWMAGHVFPALEKCRIKFPQHADTIQALQQVTLPSCAFLRYQSNDLQPLRQFHLPSLVELEVRSVEWNVWRGNSQLAALYPKFAVGLTSLYLTVTCSTQLLVFMLRLVPALKTLWLGLASPNALSNRFFRAFIVKKPNPGCTSDTVGAPSQTVAPLCPSLEWLVLEYRRWLRGPDKRALIAALSEVVASRQRKKDSSFQLTLMFDEDFEGWTIGKPVRKLQDEVDADVVLGISTSHGIIPISTKFPPISPIPLPFKEAEYLQLWTLSPSTILEFLLIHDHMELILYRNGRMPPPTSLPGDLPLFCALRVLVVRDTHPGFLIGHTFLKLERCSIDWCGSGHIKNLSAETKMPVCTRVDINDPYLLATFKLPQIQELALDFSHPKCNAIWEKQIAVNANLSGLVLLHMRDWPSDGDLTPILTSLPLLETLIICSSEGVVSLRALLPMDENGTSELKQTRGEGKTLALLCPRLQHLQIEVSYFWAQPELIPFVKDVVSLRAECGSPLKSFTWSKFGPKPGGRFDLIDGGFAMEEITEAERFELDM